MPDVEVSTRSTLVAAIFDAIDHGDLDKVGSILAEDVHIFFGNADPVVGMPAFAEFYAQFMGEIVGVRHEVHDVWQSREDAAVFIARMTVHYQKKSGNWVSLPCCNVFRFRENVISEYRVYLDPAPVFSDSGDRS
jgi:ketosteroid isomerase-like protein